MTVPESGRDRYAHNGNAGTGDNSYGLWQINMIGALGPARRAQFGLSSNEQLYDARTNARAALAIYRGQGWNAWATSYGGGSGAFRASMGAALAAAARVGKLTPAQKDALLKASGSTGSTGSAGGSSDTSTDTGGGDDYQCTYQSHKGVGGSIPIIGGVLKGVTGAGADVGAALGYVACLMGKAALWIIDPTNWLRILEVTLGATMVIGGVSIMARGTLPTSLKGAMG